MKHLIALAVLVMALGCGDKITNTYIVDRSPLVPIYVVITDKVPYDTWYYCDSTLFDFTIFKPMDTLFPGFHWVCHDTVFAPEGSHLQARYLYNYKEYRVDTTAINKMIWVVTR